MAIAGTDREGNGAVPSVVDPSESRISRAQTGRSALVLFSGGQDSTTCLFWAKQQFQNVRALGFDYGQRHAVELLQAEKIAVHAGVPFEVLSLTGLLGDSALTSVELPLDEKHPGAPTLPASFVPARNLLFLTVAAGRAFTHSINDLVTGMCQTDYSGYPDCRRVFADSLQTTLSLAMAPRDFRIHTPLMYLNKAETFRMAEELGVLELVVEMTHTDYNGDRSQRHPWGYGKLDNDASRLRARGWEEFQKRFHPPQ